MLLLSALCFMDSGGLGSGALVGECVREREILISRVHLSLVLCICLRFRLRCLLCTNRTRSEVAFVLLRCLVSNVLMVTVRDVWTWMTLR